MILSYDSHTGLIPAIIQDSRTSQVLMLGYMNEEAFNLTSEEKRVTFVSRSKNRLWTKGEQSGNYLNVVEISHDCDSDALLVKVIPEGHTCHTGSTSCFREETAKGFLYRLEETMQQRIDDKTRCSS